MMVFISYVVLLRVSYEGLPFLRTGFHVTVSLADIDFSQAGCISLSISFQILPMFAALSD